MSTPGPSDLMVVLEVLFAALALVIVVGVVAAWFVFAWRFFL